MEANVKVEAPDQEEMEADHDERAEPAPNNPTDHSDEGEYVTDDEQKETVQPSAEEQRMQGEATAGAMETAETANEAEAAGRNNSEMESEVEDRGAEDRAEDPPATSDQPEVEQKDPNTTCRVCGLFVKAAWSLRKHEALHSADGFGCSLCGAAFPAQWERNAHERKIHCFQRHQNDKIRKEAIRLTHADVEERENVGTNIDEVQRNAVGSAADWDAEQLSAIGIVQTNCSICGLDQPPTWLKHHEESHAAPGAVCSLCGIRSNEPSNRNRHEQRVHNYERHEHDQKRMEAIRLTQEELRVLENVGRNIDEVRDVAVESWANLTADEVSVMNPMRPACPICGCKPPRQHFAGHVKAHSRDGDMCSLCGIRCLGVSNRNSHEQEVHGFVRHEYDRKRQEVIRLTQEQIELLENVGTNFEDVQKDAVESWANLSVNELLAKGVPQLECPVCGLLQQKKFFEEHVNSHSAQGATCSLCGARKTKTSNRNAHEREVHSFLRHKHDLNRTEAIRLAAEEIEQLQAVGTNIAEVQKDAVESYANAPAEFLATLAVKRPQKLEKFPCRVCGFKLPRFNLERHEPSHSDDGFECSVCGLQKVDYYQRNQHERDVHEFYRVEHDKKIEQAVQIPPEELAHFKNLGINLKKVQRCALPNGASVGSSGAHRRHTMAVDDSARPSPSNWPSRKRAAAEELFDESYDTQPAHSPVTPSSRPIAFRRAQPAVQQPIVAPIEQAGGKSRAQLVMEALFRRPELVFYDHHDLSAEFKTLPIGSWKNSADCSLLLVRSATPELSGGLQLPAVSFSVLLTDRPGHVVCFAKPHGEATADRLRLQLQPAVSFAQLMGAVDRSGVLSALIISNDSPSVHGRVAERFVFV